MATEHPGMLQEPGVVWDTGAEMGLRFSGSVCAAAGPEVTASPLCLGQFLQGKGVCAALLDKLHLCGFACSFSVSLKSI